MKSLLVLSMVAGLAGVAATSRAEESRGRHPLTVEDLWAMDRVGSPAVSPDGSLAAFPVTRYSKDENKGNSDLWLVPTDGSEAPRRLTWNEGRDSSPVFSPDGHWLAFVSKRGEGPSQLYRLPLGGGEAEPLTELPMGVRNPKWFPDGRRIAFDADTYPGLGEDFEAIEKRRKEAKDDKTQAKISDNRLLRYWDEYRTSGTVPHVFAVDLETREVQDLTPDLERLTGLSSFSWDLSPDGGEIAYAANSTEPPWKSLNYDIYLLDLASGETRNLTSGHAPADGSPKYSPDGKWLYFGRNRRVEISPDFTRLARYDRESGAIAEVLPDWDGEPSDWELSEDGRTLYFHAQNRGRRSLYSVPADGGTPRVLFEGGSTSGVATAGNQLVFLAQSFHQPPELMVIPAAGGDARALTALNAERLAEIEFGEVEDVTFEGAGGEPVQMFVLKPHGYDPSKKWPLLMMVHGGPHGAWLDSFHFRWNAALFGAPGYVVAALNFHGSTGFGQSFAESILGNHAEKPFTDVMKATDFLLARGDIDPERMAAAGGSYGGYLVSWILGHTDRFAALINHAGVYDLMAQFSSDYTWSRSNNYGASPWEDPDRIDLYSPSRFAKSFETPTLILHGEKDYRVPYTQGINLHHVLTGKGVPSRIVIFPNENHWILKPQAAELWWNEVHAWLDRYIGEGKESTPSE